MEAKYREHIESKVKFKQVSTQVALTVIEDLVLTPPASGDSHSKRGH